MNYIIFFIVAAAACFAICRIPFIKKSGLSTRTILVLFLIKIMAACISGYITWQVTQTGSDNWALNELSQQEQQLFLSNPGVFFKELFISNYHGTGYDNLFGSFGSFWNDLENNILSKALALFNFISGGFYYTNSILFNFFGFFGNIALFRVFCHLYPGRRIAALLGSFLLPTTLFFSTALSKDNVVFTALAMFCFCLYFFTLAGFTAKRTGWLIFFFCAVLLMRNHIALLLLPPAIAFYASYHSKAKAKNIFALCMAVLLVLLVVVPFLFPSLNPAAIIAQKQKDFLALGIARSQIEVPAMEPTTAGLLKNLPGAFLNGYFRPWIWETKNIFMTLQALELCGYLLLFIGICIVQIQRKKTTPPSAFILFALLFTALVFVMNGYIVPNTNTLSRYRSIYLPLIITPLLCNVNLWGKLNHINLKNI